MAGPRAPSRGSTSDVGRRGWMDEARGELTRHRVSIAAPPAREGEVSRAALSGPTDRDQPAAMLDRELIESPGDRCCARNAKKGEFMSLARMARNCAQRFSLSLRVSV